MANNKTEFVISARDETRAAFQAVQGSFEKLNSTASTFGFGGLTAGLAVFASGAAFAGAINGAISFAGKLDDMSEATGASVENLSALSGVAKIGGHDLDSIAGSVSKLNKVLHGSEDETKGAGKALAAFGLDVQKLRDMDPAEAMLELAKAQDKFADGGGKSAALMAILGKNAAAIIPFLKDLAEQERLVGKVSAEQAAQAEAYEKNIKRLEGAWGSLTREMAANVVGPAKDVTDWMVKAQKEGGALQAILVGIGAAMTKALGGEINPLKSAEGDVSSAFEKFSSLKKAIAKTEADLNTGNFGILGEGYGRRRLDDLKKSLADAESVLKGSIARRNKLSAEADEQDKEKSKELNNQQFGAEGGDKSKKKSDAEAIIKGLNEQLAVKQLDLEMDSKLTEGQRLLAKTMADVESGAIKVSAAELKTIQAKGQKLIALEREITMQGVISKGADDEQLRLSKHFDSLDEEARKLERQAELYGLTEAQISVVSQARISDALAIAKQSGASEGEIAVLERELAVRERISDARVDIDRKKQSIDEVNDATKKGADAAKEFGLSMTSAFEDAVVEGKELSEVISGLAKDLGKMFLRKSVTEPLAGFASDLFKDFFKSPVANADGGVYSSPSLSAYSGKVYDSPRMFAFASGAGIFAEAGPEAIMPLKRGPDGKLGVQASGSSGVSNVTINIDASGTKTEGDAGSARELGRRIESAVRGVLIVERRPGGLLA